MKLERQQRVIKKAVEYQNRHKAEKYDIGNITTGAGNRQKINPVKRFKQVK